MTTKRNKKINPEYTLEVTFLPNIEILKWNSHVSNICTKAYRTIGFLRRNLYPYPQDVKEATHKGLVRPILEYGSSV